MPLRSARSSCRAAFGPGARAIEAAGHAVGTLGRRRAVASETRACASRRSGHRRQRARPVARRHFKQLAAGIRPASRCSAASGSAAPASSARPATSSLRPRVHLDLRAVYKGAFADGRLRLGANVFYTDWQGQQVEGQADPDDFTSTFVTNAGSSHSSASPTAKYTERSDLRLDRLLRPSSTTARRALGDLSRVPAVLDRAPFAATRRRSTSTATSSPTSRRAGRASASAPRSCREPARRALFHVQRQRHRGDARPAPGDRRGRQRELLRGRRRPPTPVLPRQGDEGCCSLLDGAISWRRR